VVRAHPPDFAGHLDGLVQSLKRVAGCAGRHGSECRGRFKREGRGDYGYAIEVMYPGELGVHGVL
jgi:hypothetical protein